MQEGCVWRKRIGVHLYCNKGQLHTPEARITRCNEVTLGTQVLGGWETHKKAYCTGGMANLVNSDAISGSMDCIYGARI